MQRRWIAALLLVLCAPIARSQELRGVVRDSASGQPIPGAVLVLLDTAGRVLGRNITNESGAYRLALDPAIRRIRVLRIGFRPRELEVAAGSRTAQQLNLVMAAIPTLLEPVHVVDNPACPRRPDRAAAFALWEQAKAALLATVVAREANPAQVLRYTFDRTMSRDGRTVAHQIVRADSATTTRPFAASGSAAEFVEHGFRDDSSEIGIYYGPDAEVLLDDAFTSAYCFRLADRDVARPGQVGIAFDAAKRRRGRVTIDGAVWIDTTARSMVDVLWHYAGVEIAIERYEPGGHVWFREMPNGSMVIDRWYIRLPDVVRDARRPRSVLRTELHERGGELVHAQWPDGPAWQAALGFLHGAVTLNGAAAPGRVVQLLDTPYQAVTDSAGQFTMRDLLPGPYQIGFVDSTLATIGLLLSEGTQFTAARDSVTDVTLEAPTTRDYAAGLCGRDALPVSEVVLAIRVRQASGESVGDATVRVRADVGDGVVRELAHGSTDNRGLVHMCHAPAGAAIFVSAEHEGYRVGTKSAQTAHPLTAIDVRLEPQRP